MNHDLLETTRPVQFPNTQRDASKNAKKAFRVPCEAAFYNLSKVLGTRKDSDTRNVDKS